MMDFCTVFRLKSERLVAKEAGSEMVLVPLVNDIASMTDMLALNEVAASIVKAMDGKKSLDEICRLIYEEYEVDEQVLRDDAMKFITQAIEKNIVEPVVAPVK